MNHNKIVYKQIVQKFPKMILKHSNVKLMMNMKHKCKLFIFCFIIIQRIVDGLPVANLQDLSRCGDLPDPNEKLDPNAKYTRPDGFPIGCAETKVILSF